MTVQPIRPSDFWSFPDAVIEAFNELITANRDAEGESTFTQDNVVALIVAKGLTEDEIYRNKWLDVEPLYESVGWIVSYDKPGYDEEYPARFTFTTRNRKTR